MNIGILLILLLGKAELYVQRVLNNTIFYHFMCNWENLHQLNLFKVFPVTLFPSPKIRVLQGIFSILYGKITSTFYLGPKNTHLETLLAAICQTERQFYSLIPWELPTLFLRPPSSLVLTFQLMAGREMKTYPFQSPFNKALFINQRFCTKGALRKRVWNVIFLKTSSSTQFIKTRHTAKPWAMHPLVV